MKKYVCVIVIVLVISLVGCNGVYEESTPEIEHNLDTTTAFSFRANVTYSKDVDSEIKISTLESIGVTKDKGIKPELRDEVQRKVNTLLDLIRENNYKGIQNSLIQDDFSMKEQYLKIYVEELNKLVQNSEVEIKAEYYGNVPSGFYWLESPIDARYLLKLNGSDVEKYLSFVKVKKFNNEEYITFELIKGQDGWLVKSIGIGCYRKGNKTAFDWLEEAQELMAKDQIMPAFIYHQVAYLVMPPNSYPRNEHVKRLFEVQNKLMNKLDNKFKQRPLILDEIKTKPKLYTVLPDYWLTEDNFGYSIHYVTSLSKNDKQKIIVEADNIHEYLKKEMKFDEVGHYTYVAYFDIPEYFSSDYQNKDTKLTIIVGDDN